QVHPLPARRLPGRARARAPHPPRPRPLGPPGRQRHGAGLLVEPGRGGVPGAVRDAGRGPRRVAAPSGGVRVAAEGALGLAQEGLELRLQPGERLRRTVERYGLELVSSVAQRLGGRPPSGLERCADLLGRDGHGRCLSRVTASWGGGCWPAEERDPRRRCGEAGAPSPLRFGAAEWGTSIGRRARRLMGAPTAPRLPAALFGL